VSGQVPLPPGDWKMPDCRVPSLADDLGSRRFDGTWRRYQELALAKFDEDQAAGDRSFYVVMPPGAGKTVVGLEAARRMGRRTLVLAPNTAVQGQWAATWDARFGPSDSPCGTDRDLSAPVTVLTYQSIAVIDRGTTAEQRRAVLREGDRQALLNLLHPNGRAVIELAATLGPWTLVLDECHHLLATWGGLVRAIVDQLGADTALIGLTATPPHQLTGWQRTLHDELFGATDFEIQAPALVKEGDLAPYRELVYLTQPTPEEDTWLASEGSRFADLQIQLVDKQLGTIPLAVWLDRRAVERSTVDGVRASWGAFEHAEPALALAALRFAHAGMISVPEGARIREQHRSSPDAADWVAVLSDFCRGHLQLSDDPADVAALTAIKRALPGLGYQLTAQGVRSSTSPVDRLCGLSESKIAGAVHILQTEDSALGPALRALVLCDFEQLAARLPASLASAPIDQESGSARLMFTTLASADVGGAGELRPVLITGQTFACATPQADELVEFCRAAGVAATAEPLTAGTSRIVGPSDVSTRVWVRLATEYFTAGGARVLVGTRALLGEGWDCPVLNVTVDLTTATTSTAITQMRGRSLRRDPADPAKFANNWTVCCVTDQHPRGDADYERLVRKHDLYFALTESGEIESGVTHCDPALSPFAAPTADDAAVITTKALDQAGSRAEARAAWRIGEPSEGVELATVRVRSSTSLGTSVRTLPVSVQQPILPGQHAPKGRVTGTATGAGAAVAAVAVTAVAAGPAAGIVSGAVVVVAGMGALAAGAVRGSSRLASAQTAVEQFAAVVADALHVSDGSDRGAAAVQVLPTPDGWLRCELAGVPVEQSQRFSAALDELLSPLAEPKHLVGRRVVRVPATRRGRFALATRALLGLPGTGAVAWHAVPQWCAANPRRLRAFLDAWQTWIGPPSHLTADSPEGYAVLELFRGEDPFAVTTQLRTLWR
jgi:superfamily II DNA or RNA helicase